MRRAERERLRAIFEKRYSKPAESYSDIDEESSDSDKNKLVLDTWEKMYKRIIRNNKKRELRKRVQKLIEFQQKLVWDFEAIQLEVNQEKEDNREIINDVEFATQEEMEALFVRRLDKRLTDIFLKTELFYQYHHEVEQSI